MLKLKSHIRVNSDKKENEKTLKPLVVYEAVLKFGPISHDDLYKKIGFSRSATFRALRHLEEAGWVRRLINNHHFVATSFVDELASVGSTSLSELDMIFKVLSEVNISSKFVFKVGLYISKSTYCILESSSKNEPVNTIVYPFESCAALVAYCFYSSVWSEKMLFDPNQFFNEYDFIEMKERLMRCKKSLSKRDFFYCHEEQVAAIGVKVGEAFVGSISVKQKDVSKDKVKPLINELRRLSAGLERNELLAKIKNED